MSQNNAGLFTFEQPLSPMPTNRSRRMRRSLLVMVCMLAMAAPAGAQFVAGTHLIPVVARLQGAEGTYWKTDLSISNTGHSQAVVQATFFREKQANTFPSTFPVQVTVAPGQTLLVEDVLASWFPTQGDTKGALLLSALPEEIPLAVTSRTYNAADPLGTYGQAVPSAFLNIIYGLGQAIIPGIKNDQNYRTSLGILNIGPFTAYADIAAYDANGARLTTVTKTIQKFSLEQWNVQSLGVPTIVGGGRIVVQLAPNSTGYQGCDPGDFLFSPILMVYASTVDNRTGDAVFSLSQVSWMDYEDNCGSAPDDECGPVKAGIIIP